MEELVITDEFITTYSSDKNVISFVQGFFNQMSCGASTKLIECLLKQKTQIHINEINSAIRFYNWNTTKFDNNKFLKDEVLVEVKDRIINFLKDYSSGITIVDSEVNEKVKEKIEQDERRYYSISDKSTYEIILKQICDEGGEIKFHYDFDLSKLPITQPSINRNTIQRCYIQVLSEDGNLAYPVMFKYVCPECNKQIKIKPYEVFSSNNKIKCDGVKTVMTKDGDIKEKRCSEPLSASSALTTTYESKLYTIRCSDVRNGDKVVNAICLEKIPIGYYECVLMHEPNSKRGETYHILTYKDVPPVEFSLPKKVNGENYLFSLQKDIDNFIERQTGMGLFGLVQPKVSFILQTLADRLNLSKTMHIALVGDPSTGKTIVSKYYGFMMNNNLNMSTSGHSISIPGLRGTRQSISLFGKEESIITPGFLGTYKSICIDEAGENKELVQDLKAYLFEYNYDYSKAGGNGCIRRRTAHVNITENIGNEYLQQYRASIKKAYRDINFRIGEIEKEEWQEDWDLHLPLYKYEWNPYLLKVVKEKRQSLANAGKWWIDGRDYAIHERFPFYFYMVNKKENPKLKNVIIQNSSKEIIKDNLELLSALRTNDLDNWMASLKKYISVKDEYLGFLEVDKILDSYNIKCDSRTLQFYYMLIKLSRIANMREETNEEDYDLLKIFIEKMNCKVDVADMCDYGFDGSPNTQSLREKEKLIEESNKGDIFGMPDGEF